MSNSFIQKVRAIILLVAFAMLVGCQDTDHSRMDGATRSASNGLSADSTSCNFETEKTSQASTQVVPSSSWKYKVSVFSLEKMDPKFGFAGAIITQYNVAPSQFDPVLQDLSEGGWEYAGVIHATVDLEENRTYVLFRKRER